VVPVERISLSTRQALSALESSGPDQRLSRPGGVRFVQREGGRYATRKSHVAAGRRSHQPVASEGLSRNHHSTGLPLFSPFGPGGVVAGVRRMPPQAL